MVVVEALMTLPTTPMASSFTSLLALPTLRKPCFKDTSPNREKYHTNHHHKGHLLLILTNDDDSTQTLPKIQSSFYFNP